MFLDVEEFKKIRPLRWGYMTSDGKLYHTVLGKHDRKCFWIDFLNNVFLKYFKNQNAVMQFDFDTANTVVMMTDDYELKLPQTLETILYYSKKSTPIRIETSYTCLPVLIIVFILFAIIVYTQRNKNIHDIIGDI